MSAASRAPRWPLFVSLIGGLGLVAVLLRASPDPEPGLPSVPDRFVGLEPLAQEAPLPELGEVAPLELEAPDTAAPAQADEVAAQKKKGSRALGLSAGHGSGAASDGVLGLVGKGGDATGNFGDRGGGLSAGKVGNNTGSLGSSGYGMGGGGTAMGAGGLGTRGSARGSKGSTGQVSSYGQASSSGAGKARSAMRGNVVLMGKSSADKAVVASLQSARDTAPGLLEALFAQQQRGEALPLTQVSADPLSTFAADVDTGSYTVSRRALREGRVPHQSTVRVEEFINYWRYDYAQPTGKDPVSAQVELVPHPDHAGRHLLKVGVQARTIAERNRKPVRLTFLVDVSGSMRGSDRLGLIQKALHHAIDRMGDEDTVAIVTYAGRTEVLAEPTPMSRRATLHTAIERLTSSGGTNMGSGVALAYQLAEQAWVEGAENRVIVLSDGDANIGQTGPDAILQTIRKHAEGGITLTTMGFGTGNYNDQMMEKLADAGDGAYVYVDSEKEARRVLGKDLGATLETVARDLKLQVDFNPDAVLGWRQVGYVNRQIADHDFRNDKVDAGEVGSGHQVTALYELELKPGWDAAVALGTVRMRAKPPGPDRPAKEWSVEMPAAATSVPSADLRMAVASMHLADGLHSRRRGPVERAQADAKRLAQQGRRGADELLELSTLALRALGAQGGLAQAQ